LIFGIEIFIAEFAHDHIVQPYIGDLLAVILIYCCIRSILNTPTLKTAFAVLLFSYNVQVLQYFDVIGKLAHKHSAAARMIIGTSFEWIDPAAYKAGVTAVIYIEKNKVEGRPEKAAMILLGKRSVVKFPFS